jgi:hypothetical protein
MKRDEEEFILESVRMIEAHLERIANALEALVPALVPPAKEPEFGAGARATVTTPTLGPLEIMAHHQKETYDRINRRPERPRPHWD